MTWEAWISKRFFKYVRLIWIEQISLSNVNIFITSLKYKKPYSKDLTVCKTFEVNKILFEWFESRKKFYKI